MMSDLFYMKNIEIIQFQYLIRIEASLLKYFYVIDCQATNLFKTTPSVQDFVQRYTLATKYASKTNLAHSISKIFFSLTAYLSIANCYATFSAFVCTFFFVIFCCPFFFILLLFLTLQFYFDSVSTEFMPLSTQKRNL